MKVGNIVFEKGLFLAPMAGVSDVGFRSVCSDFGAEGCFSEMLSCRAMLHNPSKTVLMTIVEPNEKIKIGQIFGHEPEIMTKAVRNPLLDKYDIIAINMGCPAPKVVKNGEGCALMSNVCLAEKIIKACVENTKRPVSVKFRLGKDKDISLEFGKMCQEAGASFVTLHARTLEQGYSGKANYDAIAKLSQSLEIPVIGNGDVVDKQSYNRMLTTGASAVMIGRGAQGKPWIFQEVLGQTFDGDKYKVIEKHLTILRKYYNEDWLKLYMRKHFLWYTSDLKFAAEARLKLATTQNLDESMEILKQLLK